MLTYTAVVVLSVGAHVIATCHSQQGIVGIQCIQSVIWEYFGCEDISKRSYLVFTVTPDAFSYELEPF